MNGNIQPDYKNNIYKKIDFPEQTVSSIAFLLNDFSQKNQILRRRNKKFNKLIDKFKNDACELNYIFDHPIKCTMLIAMYGFFKYLSETSFVPEFIRENYKAKVENFRFRSSH